MLATKGWVMWSEDEAKYDPLRICDRETWNYYAKKYVDAGKPTEYRFVTESDDKEELHRMKNLAKEN